MEVLFISHKYPPSIGGMQKQSFELIERFSKDHTARKIIINHNQTSFSFFFKLKIEVARIFKKYPNIELVHCNDGVSAFFSRFIKEKYGVPIVTTFHGLDLLWPLPLYQKILSSSYSKLFDAFIAVSDFTFEHCHSVFNSKDNIHMVPNGVDFNVTKTHEINESIIELISELKNQNKKILVSVGRPTKRKGFKWFVKNVMSKLNKCHYIIIGPKATEKNIFKSFLYSILPKSMVNYLNLGGGSFTDQEFLKQFEFTNQDIDLSTTWLTDCDDSELTYVLENSDLFVMPNIKVEGDAEGFGLVGLESIVRGCYVMASDVDGIPSAIHNLKNGSLIRSQDADVWYNAIKDFLGLNDAQKQNKLNKAYTYTLSNFSWDKMAEGYIRVFHKVIAKNN